MIGLYDNSYRIIDSIPIPVCKFGRARFHKTFRGYGATYGNCPSKKETYFGYKLHMLVSFNKKNSKIEFFEDSGHMLFWENSERFNQVIKEFVD